LNFQNLSFVYSLFDCARPDQVERHTYFHTYFPSDLLCRSDYTSYVTYTLNWRWLRSKLLFSSITRRKLYRTLSLKII